VATEVVMPQMGYDMTEGTVVRWVKHEGDDVKRGETIAEIETDKATIEMEASASGVLRRIVVEEGKTVPVGQVIGFIGAEGEEIPDVSVTPVPAAPAEPAAVAEEASSPTPEPATAPATEAPAAAGEPLRASPVARRLADEHGININQVQGTGPGGRIVKDDVLAFVESGPAATPEAAEQEPVAEAPVEETSAEAPAEKAAPVQAKGAPAPVAPVAPGEATQIPLTKMGQAIARRTQQTNRDVPAYYVSVSVDMTKAMEFRKELNQSLADAGHVSVNDLIIKACAMAVERYPKFNSIFKDDHLEVPAHVNIGVAIALEAGLIVPAVLACETKSLVQIARETKDLGERARSGKLRQDEYTLATFSISNLGMYRINSFTAIIHEPGTAVAAIGAVMPQAVPHGGQVVVRDIMQVTLSADHRASNGADGAEFMVEVKRLLETPLLLVA
jgi:pyruvate dehydrogenase E2 component (dihydrolipoamide acetyltransferase)